MGGGGGGGNEICICTFKSAAQVSRTTILLLEMLTKFL